MNKRLIGSLLMAVGFLSGCASSQTSYPAASPPTDYYGGGERSPDGYWVLRSDGTPGSPAQWEWVQRPRASSPAPEAPFASRR